MEKAKLGNKGLLVVIALALLLFFYILFGFKADLFLISIILVAVPFYLILSLFELNESEKIIFSVFIGIGLFSSLTYWLGFLFSSLKIAASATFVLLIVYWFLMKKLKLEKYREEIILIGLSMLVFLAGIIIKSLIVTKLPVPKRIIEYLNCLKNNTADYCKEMVRYISS